MTTFLAEEIVNHTPIIVGIATVALTVVGGIFAGGVAWGRINHRTNTIEHWIISHTEWGEGRSQVIDELKNITTRLDAILESRVIPFIEHHERQDELDRLK